jgi:hypothetical protein
LPRAAGLHHGGAGRERFRPCLIRRAVIDHHHLVDEGAQRDDALADAIGLVPGCDEGDHP